MWILLLLSFCHNAPQKAESDCGEEPLNVVEDLYVLVVLCCLYRFADFNIFPIAECMGSEPMYINIHECIYDIVLYLI